MKYFRTLLNEKGISLDTVLEVQGKEWGFEMIPVKVVVEFMETRSIETQKKMRNNLTKIDFMDGDVLNFFTYVATFMAK